jgi:hypothetical protein
MVLGGADRTHASLADCTLEPLGASVAGRSAPPSVTPGRELRSSLVR